MKMFKDSIQSKTYYSIIAHNGEVSCDSTLIHHALTGDKFSGLQDAITSHMIASAQCLIFVFDGDTGYRLLFNTYQSYAIAVRRVVTHLMVF